MSELLPCPFCGNKIPFEYISPWTAVIRCECGIELHQGSAHVLYQRDEVPEALKAHTYEPTCLVVERDGKQLPYPDHGYVGVNVMAAFEFAGLTEKWNRRAEGGEVKRTLDQWVNCDPATMATMSQAAIMYAFRDAKCDIKELHDLVKRFCNAIADEHTNLLFLKREAENIIGATKDMQQHGENVANFMDKKYPNLI